MFGKVMLTGLALAAFGLTRFIFNILVIRQSATFLGEINQVLSLFMFVPLIYAPPLGQLISKFASEFIGSNEPQKSRQIFSLSFLLVVVASAVCTVLVLVFFSQLSGSLQVRPATLCGLAPMLVLYSFYIFLRTSYYGFDRISLYLRNEIIASIVFFVVLGVALAKRSEWLVVMPFAAHSVVFVALAIYHLRDQFRFRAMFAGIAADLRRCAHFLIHTMIISVTGPGAFHLGIILTGRLTGNPEIAAYLSVFLYSLQPLNLLPISVASVMIPTISQHYGAGRTREGVEVAERSFLAVFLAMTAIWGGGVVLGREAVRAISGTATGEMVVAFEVILFAIYLYMISTPPSVLLNSTKHVAVIAWSGLAATAVGVGVWFAAIPAYGLIGAAAGYAVLQVGKAAWAFLAARRILQWRAQLGWAALFTVLLIAALGSVSLVTGSLWAHVGIAVLFVGLFLALNARSVLDYSKRFLAEVRAFAPVSLAGPSDSEGC